MMVRLGKRLVISPRVYLRDSGVLHALLGLASVDDESSADLRPARRFIVYPGSEHYPLRDGIKAIPLPALASALAGLGG